jgi:hypothetical protein
MLRESPFGCVDVLRAADLDLASATVGNETDAFYEFFEVARIVVEVR